MSTSETTPIPVPLDDAVIVIRVRAKSVTAAGIHVSESAADKERRIGKVVAVGPGKLIPLGGSAAAKMSTVCRINGEQEPDALRALEAELMASKVSADRIEALTQWEPPRYPMNVKPGDYVVFTNGVIITPYGPATQEYILTRNEFIGATLPGFSEHTEADEEASRGAMKLALPVPSALVDPTSGMPFRPPGTGRA